ncbi:MAG: STAS domain-containing protein [Actinobacteria bacterium]|nr:STAS domain-containing protein [Actinomycetota bacterium]
MSNQDFNIEHRQDGSRAVVTMSGEFDMLSIASTEKAFGRLLGRTEPIELIEVDMSQVSFIDSSGIAMLVDLKKKIEAAKGKLRVVSPSPFVQKVFRVTGLSEVIEISMTLDDSSEAGGSAPTPPE